MRKQLRPLVLFACLAATAFGSQIAAAETGSPTTGAEVRCGHDHQGHHGRDGHRGRHFFKKMARALGLTDQQKSQAKALYASNRAENKPLLATLLTERQQLRALILSGSADEAAIRAQSARVAAVEADLAVRRGQGSRQFLALLTPDQVTKLKGIEAARELRFQGCAADGALPAK